MGDTTIKDDLKKAGLSFSRREFLKTSGMLVIGVGVGGCTMIDPLPASKGYLLVDTKKCQGCVTCMLACVLADKSADVFVFRHRLVRLQNPQAFVSDSRLLLSFH